tara:strand:+ start:115 stop:303 length:189 start_codon:yes stop_codon:yes gene_type:complete
VKSIDHDDEGKKTVSYSEKRFNMTSVPKMLSSFAGGLSDACKRAFDRSTNDMKKLASQCLLF